MSKSKSKGKKEPEKAEKAVKVIRRRQGAAPYAFTVNMPTGGEPVAFAVHPPVIQHSFGEGLQERDDE